MTVIVVLNPRDAFDSSSRIIALRGTGASQSVQYRWSLSVLVAQSETTLTPFPVTYARS